MKFSYSLIKKLLPGAPSKARLIDGLSMHSFETEDAGGDILEISLPANRWSDAASHIGIAREVAAVFSLKFKNPVKLMVNYPAEKGLVSVDVKDAKLCPRYSARYFELQKLGDSPKWMRDTLISCGLQPINSIVDIMNYVMLETGQPLHAFDADKLVPSTKRQASRKKRKLTAGIVVRRAAKEEKMTTLDGQHLVLDQSVLVIASSPAAGGLPLAVAGIKGGQGPAVGPKTKRIVVEAASFNAASVYRAARKLNLPTDAAQRFGHGLSPALVEIGLDRATELLLKNKAWLLDSVDVYPRPVGDEVIEFDARKYESVIGGKVDEKKARKYFELLGFELEEPKSKTIGQKLLVRIPSWRTDIEEPEDLIEEIIRLEGYGKLKPRPPLVSLLPAREEDTVIFKDKVRRVLHGYRLDEVYNSSFLGDADLAMAESAGFGGARSALIEVENPIADDKKYLRPSLLPLLVKNIGDNARFFGEMGIFEIGKIFEESPGKTPVEKLSLGVALAGKKEPKLILELKGLAEDVLRGLGVDDFSIIERGAALRVEADHKVLGIMRQADSRKGMDCRPRRV